MRSLAMIFLALSSLTGAGAAGEYESFEQGVPSCFSAPRADSLSTSTRHSKHGANSLRWDWARGEQLFIRHGLGDVTRRGGFNDRASFAVWLYCEAPVAADLVFEFREGQRVTGAFRFPLNFTGWRQGRPFYADFPEGKPTSAVDNIVIKAPETLERGTVFIDLLRYNTLTYPGRALLPEKEARWQRPVPDEKRFPRPAQVTEAEQAAIHKLLAQGEPTGVAEARVAELCGKVSSLGIVRDEQGIRGGPGIDRLLQYCCDFGELGSKDQQYWPDERGPVWEGVESPARLSSLAYDLATAYRAAREPQQRRRLAEAFLLLEDHLYDQGMQAGAGFHWNWWYGGSWADAVFLMRDVLAQAGRLQRQCDYFLWNWGGDIVVSAAAPPSHMDFYLLDVPRLLRACLLQVEPADQVRWLRAYKDMLERSILQPTSALKIDGSAYHHGGNYFHYAFAGVPGLAGTVQQLSDTPWRLSPEAHERVRRAALAQRLFCNRLEEPLSTRGRMPFTKYSVRILPQGLDALARSGSPDGTERLDVEAARAYLRLAPEAAQQEPYRSSDLTPELDPTGCFVMPYGALLSYRRDDWLASVHGQSKYLWGTERQGKVNCFSLFQGLGSLEIMAGGNPVTAEGSGRQEGGFDWTHYEGTTAPQLPLQQIDKQWTSALSSETFVGGLSHRGQDGLFAITVNQPLPGGKTIRARKSWLLLGNRVLCLGAGISCDSEYPVETTLCQRALPSAEGAHVSTWLDGAQVSAFPEQSSPDRARPHWFINAQQTGCYLPAGVRAVIGRRTQHGRNYTDQADTSGDFLTACIDHGVAPTAGAYEYLLVVRATPETMRRTAASPPYRVLQCDERAHVVWDNESRHWACVLFEAQELTARSADGEALQVRAADRPCLLMQEALPEGRLAVSVADPDLNLEAGVSQPRPLRLTLRGAWSLAEARATVNAWKLPEAETHVRVVSAGAAGTVAEITCQHGASYDLTLTPAR